MARGAHLAAADAAAAGSAGASPAACGAASAATLARTVGMAAKRIYQGELASAKVRADRRQVEGNRALLSAVASGERARIVQAVTSLVYSHTHIVRLRVTRGGAVLADVGGPYIIAPVGGRLRLNGRTIGHYLLSVQDDLGYVKLERRFVGVPLVLQVGGRPLALEGALAPGPAQLPDLGPVSYRGASYEAFSFDARAFPQGTLRISLLVPLRGAPVGGSCATVKAAELARIAQRTWSRFSLVSAPPSAYVGTISWLTGGLSYVRAGAHQLAGSSAPGPARLPHAGTATYRHATWRVSSFAARVGARPARVYLLVR